MINFRPDNQLGKNTLDLILMDLKVLFPGLGKGLTTLTAVRLSLFTTRRTDATEKLPMKK